MIADKAGAFIEFHCLVVFLNDCFINCNYVGLLKRTRVFNLMYGTKKNPFNIDILICIFQLKDALISGFENF